MPEYDTPAYRLGATLIRNPDRTSIHEAYCARYGSAVGWGRSPAEAFEAFNRRWTDAYLSDDWVPAWIQSILGWQPNAAPTVSEPVEASGEDVIPTRHERALLDEPHLCEACGRELETTIPTGPTP